ncbi:Indole-3-glycerol phosphate synthase [Candidatus Calditenuaceae archaeon HR02]|nr:Indole-3-glycerol phosphate synthase [Candidatus Calditenuaceae archaeon HR02]
MRQLCEEARRRVAEGYYKTIREGASLTTTGGLKRSILSCKGNAVIAEFKRSSPSAGVIYPGARSDSAVMAMEKGGACGVSVLTAREWFGGSLEDLRLVRATSKLPILMKDVVVSGEQIRAAHQLGAQAVLLILRAFKRGYTDLALSQAIRMAKDYSLEVLLEACGREELLEAMATDADILGVNSRDLSSLRVDKRVHEEAVMGVDLDDRVLVAESGIETAEDIRRLRRIGYRAFLVGTAIMGSGDIEAKTRELVEA